jgi:hypothetical protein
MDKTVGSECPSGSYLEAFKAELIEGVIGV